jgi:hypothetical protein
MAGGDKTSTYVDYSDSASFHYLSLFHSVVVATIWNSSSQLFINFINYVSSIPFYIGCTYQCTYVCTYVGTYVAYLISLTVHTDITV